jgi:hypothetical protein
MSHTIRFSVHRNPQKDAEGNDTYQVRHETTYTAHKADLMEHVKMHQTLRPEILEMALAVLEDEIAEHLLDNKRLHLEGLGTFFLRIGLKPQLDDEGNPLRPHITNPADITGHDVCIESIGFTPDKAFLRQLTKGIGFENINARGTVGHSANYTDEQFLARLNAYLDEHEYITCSQMRHHFGITEYMARKRIAALTDVPNPLLVGEKVGRTIIFRRA